MGRILVSGLMAGCVGLAVPGLAAPARNVAASTQADALPQPPARGGSAAVSPLDAGNPYTEIARRESEREHASRADLARRLEAEARSPACRGKRCDGDRLPAEDPIGKVARYLVLGTMAAMAAYGTFCLAVFALSPRGC